jgi:hypothetical protein
MELVAPQAHRNFKPPWRLLIAAAILTYYPAFSNGIIGAGE